MNTKTDGTAKGACCGGRRATEELETAAPAGTTAQSPGGPATGPQAGGSASAESIKAAVREHYAARVSGPSQGCCGSGKAGRGPSSEEAGQARAIGYADEELASVPGAAVSHSYGCGNPLAFAGVEAGQTVVDIGSGAGIDCFIASKKVGAAGRVIGVDMTDAMIEKARENARAGGYTNVEFRKGDAEALPVSDASVDWIISNCVINLAPDKAAVFSEIARVLRPGGRFSISDLVTAGPLPPQLAANMAAWAGCVAGAIPEAEYLEGLRQAGLADVEVAGRIVYDEATVGEFLESYGGGTQCGCTAGAVTGKVWSARITGRKPAL